MVKVGMFIETDEARVNIEPKGGAVPITVAEDGTTQVAGPGLLGIINIASCVITCLATTQRQVANAVAEAKGGQHQSPPADANSKAPSRPRA